MVSSLKQQYIKSFLIIMNRVLKNNIKTSQDKKAQISAKPKGLNPKLPKRNQKQQSNYVKKFFQRRLQIQMQVRDKIFKEGRNSSRETNLRHQTAQKQTCANQPSKQRDFIYGNKQSCSPCPNKIKGKLPSFELSSQKISKYCQSRQLDPRKLFYQRPLEAYSKNELQKRIKEASYKKVGQNRRPLFGNNEIMSDEFARQQMNYFDYQYGNNVSSEKKNVINRRRKQRNLGEIQTHTEIQQYTRNRSKGFKTGLYFGNQIVNLVERQKAIAANQLMQPSFLQSRKQSKVQFLDYFDQKPGILDEFILKIEHKQAEKMIEMVEAGQKNRAKQDQNQILGNQRQKQDSEVICAICQTQIDHDLWKIASFYREESLTQEEKNSSSIQQHSIIFENDQPIFPVSFGKKQETSKSTHREGDRPLLLNCGHSYHYQCLQEWFKYKNFCPLCKMVHKKQQSNYSEQEHSLSDISDLQIGDQFESEQENSEEIAEAQSIEFNESYSNQIMYENYELISRNSARINQFFQQADSFTSSQIRLQTTGAQQESPSSSIVFSHFHRNSESQQIRSTNKNDFIIKEAQKLFIKQMGERSWDSNQDEDNQDMSQILNDSLSNWSESYLREKRIITINDPEARQGKPQARHKEQRKKNRYWLKSVGNLNYSDGEISIFSDEESV